MAEKFLNNFLLGADPELVVLDPPSLVNSQKIARIKGHDSHFYGWDHNGFVVEPHPAPSLSARTVVSNIKKSLDVLSDRLPSYRFRAGAYYNDPDSRSVTLGGHVHLDLPHLTPDQVDAMDVFCESLLGLEILPVGECVSRAGTGYGKMSDIREERGRVEYRSMCSWLFSRKTSMFCITGIKLCAVAPQTLKPMTSIKEMQNWMEGFKGTDDDVDWILNRGYFDTSMTAVPDANVKSVWKVDPAKVPMWIAEIPAKTVQPAPVATGNDRADAILGLVRRGVILSPTNRAQLETFQRNALGIERYRMYVEALARDARNGEAANREAVVRRDQLRAVLAEARNDNYF